MKTLNEILYSPILKPYLDKVGKLNELNIAWRVIRSDLAEHCRIASFEQGVLLLHVTNSAWSTRIYYAAPEIMKELSSHPIFTNLKIVKCKLTAPASQARVKVNTQDVSARAQKIIEATASSVTHPLLKASLLKLADSIQSRTKLT